MSIEKLIQHAEQLPPDQQLQFVALLMERIWRRYQRKNLVLADVTDIQGSALYPLTGKDAQV